MTANRNLVLRLVGAVAVAFCASMALTWLLHDRMTAYEAHKLIQNAFRDVEKMIRERVDRRMIRQAMVVRDRLVDMRREPWWNDPDESSRRLRMLADELSVDEICIADSTGMLTHSARRDEVGALDFAHDGGQAGEFAVLLNSKTEFTQPLMPNSLRGEMVKYVGVWIPEGGFVQVGGRGDCIRRLSRTAVTGLTHDWHLSGEAGFIVITSAVGTIISHPDASQEGAQWIDPGEDCYWDRREIESFPVYVVIPKKTAIVERRLLVGTSAFLNGMALIFAAFLVGFVIAGYVRSQLQRQRAKELQMASDIQECAIPRVFPPFPEVREVDIWGDMKTAREVGGDFYDFYFTSSRKITFLVADVSGKGVPAALFMMRAKTALKSAAITGKPLDEVVNIANEQICDGNGACMFVTAFVCEIDLDTGVVRCVNAGHNPPLIRRGGRFEFLRVRTGLALGAMSGVKYRVFEVRLEPGDELYLYTDGITEQPDRSERMFGEDRLIATLEKFGDSPLDTLPKTVVDAVMAHAGIVEQADDCTQLVVRYNG